MTTGSLLVSLDAAALTLTVSRRTVQQLIYAGELPSVKIGRSRRIASVDLEAFVERLRNNNDREDHRLAVVTGGRGGSRRPASS